MCYAPSALLLLQAGVFFWIQRGRQIDLVLLDLVMPVLDGREAFARMRKLVPEQRIVLWSGCTAGQGIDHLLAGGKSGFMKKPASLQLFLQSVAKLLSD
jgi:CheY-like chemotaxis protein